jgi:hypothetical protein
VDALARLIAHDEIRLLASRYALAVDSRDLDALVELFVPDVRVGRDAVGRDASRAEFAASLGAIGVSMLNVTTHVIDVIDDDHATGSVYCLGEIEIGRSWVRQTILYRDTYERREGRWCFIRRMHELWYGQTMPAHPLDQVPADWPRSAVGRGTVPESWASWPAFHTDRDTAS